MDGQMNIFDFPEYLPDSPQKNKISFDDFHEHCTHRGYCKPATETEPSCWMCGFANGQPARGWDDWIPCTESNCYLLKER